MLCCSKAVTSTRVRGPNIHVSGNPRVKSNAWLTLLLDLKDLRFVSETGVKRPQGVLRDIIRSHARRKGPDGRKQSQCTTPAAGRDGEDQYSPFDDSDSRSRSRSASSSEFSLTQVPTNNSLDPFHALPISEHGHAQFLVKHCEFLTLHREPSVSCAIAFIPRTNSFGTTLNSNYICALALS